MNDLFTNSQFDVVSVGRWGGLVLSCICFSSVKLLKDLVKDPTESLEDSGYNCMSKERALVSLSRHCSSVVRAVK